MFALFAGIYYWFPRVTGKPLNNVLGHVHFWGSLIGMNGIFLPMFIQGFAGVNRRLYDGGLSYPHAAGLAHLNTGQFFSAVFLGVVQLVFIGNFIWTLMRRRRQTDDGNPWRATTLEWSAPGFTHGPIPFATSARYDTGVSNVTLGMWLFLASEVMLFGAMFSAWALLRVTAEGWPSGRDTFNLTMVGLNTALLLIASVSAWAAYRNRRIALPALWVGLASSVMFLIVKFVEYRGEVLAGLLPRTNTFFATYFTVTGLHVAHVIGAIVAAVWMLVTWKRTTDAVAAGRLKCLALYWGLIDIVWLAILGTVYLS